MLEGKTVWSWLRKVLPEPLETLPFTRMICSSQLLSVIKTSNIYYRSIISSGSNESPTLSKTTRKSTKMVDQSNAKGVDLGDYSLKDLFTQINSMKRDIDSGLDIIKTNMKSLRLEIQHDMKMIKTDIKEIQRSVNSSW